jgi:hypothetical protein
MHQQNKPKKVFNFLCLLLALFFIFFPNLGVALNNESSQSENYVLKLKNYQYLESLRENYGLKPEQIKEIPNINAVRIKNFSWKQRANLKFKELFSNNIEYLEEDKTYQLLLTPNDPKFNEQWGLEKISAPNAWNNSIGSENIKIAVVDTGVKGTHEDLNGRILAGYAYLDSGSTEYNIEANSDSDDYGHGTAISGTIGALTNNSAGIAGVDWQARLMPIKVFKSYGWGYGAYSSDIALGIIYAADNGAKVINLSLGGEFPSNAIEDAVNYAHDRGCVIIAASGNENSSVSYPAKYEQIIAVGSTNSSDERSSFSNFGPELDVTAPGDNILTTLNNGDYGAVSGTSISAAYVSGFAALLWATHSSYSNSQIESLVKTKIDKVSQMNGNNFTDYYGYGRINIYSAIIGGNNYSTSYVSQGPVEHPGRFDVAFGPGETRTVWVKFRNNGDATWYRDGLNPTQLGTSNPKDRTSVFINSNRASRLLEDSVAPGDTGTFQFTITAPTAPGLYYEHFEPVTEYVNWLGVDMHWRIYVAPVNGEYITQGPHEGPNNIDVSLNPGQQATLWTKVKNTGDATWFKSGSYPVHLGTTQPQDHTSPFINSNRVELVENYVVPGDTGTFQFTITAPNTPGTYKENLRPVMEYVGWFGPEINWTIIIN